MEQLEERAFNFTKKRLTDLQPGTARVDYRDTGQPGLILRVSPKGVKSFCVYVWVPHERKRERITIGRFPAVTVDTARTRAAELVGEVAKGKNPAEDKRRYLAQGTFGEVFEAYAQDRRARGKRSVDDMEAQFNRWLGKVAEAPKAKHARAPRTKPTAGVDWSDRRISSITATECRELHRAIVGAGKPTSANRVQEIMRSVFNFAGITPNPAASAGRGNPHGVERVPQLPRRRYLSRLELPEFLTALSNFEPEWRDFFSLLLYVGYRRSAMAAMRWSDLDLEGRTWHVPGETSKNGEPVILPITGPAHAILTQRAEKRKKKDVYVFPGDGKSGHLENPKAAWARLLEAAGISNLRMHDLRRTLGSWLATANISPLVIAKTLGHKDPRSANVYAWVASEAARSAAETAHAAFEHAAKAKR